MHSCRYLHLFDLIDMLVLAIWRLAVSFIRVDVYKHIKQNYLYLFDLIDMLLLLIQRLGAFEKAQPASFGGSWLSFVVDYRVLRQLAFLLFFLSSRYVRAVCSMCVRMCVICLGNVNPGRVYSGFCRRTNKHTQMM